MPITLRTDCAADQRRTALLAAEFDVDGCHLQDQSGHSVRSSGISLAITRNGR